MSAKMRTSSWEDFELHYKIGDKVRIKTWKKMEEEFGLNTCGDINCWISWTIKMEEQLNKLKNRTVTIEKLDRTNCCYIMKGIEGRWHRDCPEDFIECLVEKHKEPEKINSRFEILDIK